MVGSSLLESNKREGSRFTHLQPGWNVLYLLCIWSAELCKVCNNLCDVVTHYGRNTPGADHILCIQGFSVSRSEVPASRFCDDITTKQTINKHVKYSSGIIVFNRIVLYISQDIRELMKSRLHLNLEAWHHQKLKLIKIQDHQKCLPQKMMWTYWNHSATLSIQLK